jgi:hypothetical protein
MPVPLGLVNACEPGRPRRRSSVETNARDRLSLQFPTPDRLLQKLGKDDVLSRPTNQGLLIKVLLYLFRSAHLTRLIPLSQVGQYVV